MASAMKNAQLLFQQLSQKGPYSWLSCPFPGCQHSTQDRTHLVEHFFNAHSEAFDPGSITSRPNHQDVVALMLTLAFVSEQPVSSPAQFSRIRTFFERWATVHILHSRSAGGFHCPICSDLISAVISPQKVTEHVITCVPWIAKRPAGEQENCALLACFIALSKAATATEDEVLSLLESPSDFSADDQVGDFKTGSGCLSRLIDEGRVLVSSIQVAVANIVTVIEALAIMATVEGKESAWLPCRDVVLVTPSTPRIGICMEDYTAKGWISLDHFPAGDNGAILTESLRAISRAVSLAHACSVALVDLTPQNIVRTPKGEWRLVVTPRVQILHGDETDVVNLRGGSSLSVVFVPIEDRRESQWRLASDIYVLGVAYALKVLGLSVESFTRNLAYGGVLTAKLRERSKVANTTDAALIAVLLRMIDSSHGLRPAASEIDGLLTNPFARDQARIRDQGRPSRQPDRPYEEACCIQLGAFDQHDDASLPVDPVKLLIGAAQQVHAVSPIFVHLVRASDGFEAHCFPYRTLPIVRGRASAQAHRLSVTFDATGVVNRYADDAVQRGYSAQVVLKDITQHDVRLLPVKDFDDSAMLTQLRQLECHPNISRPVAIARPQELPSKPSTITDILDATLSYAVYYPDFVSLSGDYSCLETAEAEVMRKDLRNALDFLHGRGYLFGQDITWKCIAESRHRDADQIPVRFMLIAPVGGFIASWNQKHHSKERNQLDALLNGS